MASLGSLRLTPVVEVEHLDVDCPRCVAGRLDLLTVTLLTPTGVLSRRFRSCGACMATAPDLPPAESRPAGGGA